MDKFVIGPRVFGPGDRIVFAHYTKEMYGQTQKWVESWNIFDEGLAGRKNYQESVLLIPKGGATR